MATKHETSFTPLELLTKLLGPIDPVGDSGVDAGRLENMDGYFVVVDALVDALLIVECEEGSHMGSCDEAGKKAKVFLTRLHRKLNPNDIRKTHFAKLINEVSA